MSPRPSKHRKPGWPDNLYVGTRRGKKYYRYRHPVTGKEHGMGSDFSAAAKAARILNNRLLAGSPAVEQLVSGVLSGRPTFNEAADRFEKHLAESRDKRGNRLAPRTLKNYTDNIGHFRTLWGDREVDRIALEEVSNALDAMKPYAANAHRHILDRFFRFALAKGMRRPAPGEPENPAAATLKRDEVVTRRRLDQDAYDAIHARAGELGMPWFQNAMDLSLLTLQRPQTIVVIRFEDEREPGRLFVDQAKVERHGTGHLIIPVGPRLREVIRRSRDRIPCPFILHYRPERQTRKQANRKEHWAQLTTDKVSKTFSAVRDELKLYGQLPMEARPTFMEIRSLGARNYKADGWTEDQVRALMGHTTVKTTQVYLDGRGDEVEYQEAPMAG